MSGQNNKTVVINSWTWTKLMILPNTSPPDSLSFSQILLWHHHLIKFCAISDFKGLVASEAFWHNTCLISLLVDWICYTYSSSLFKALFNLSWLTEQAEKNTYWHLDTYVHCKIQVSNTFVFIRINYERHLFLLNLWLSTSLKCLLILNRMSYIFAPTRVYPIRNIFSNLKLKKNWVLLI